MKSINKYLIIILLFFTFLLFFNISNVKAYTLLELKDEALFNLIYETEQYKSGDYNFIIGSNDIDYYKIIFIKKSDNFKCYITNYGNGRATLNYSPRSAEVIYFADKNPTFLKNGGSNNGANSNFIYKTDVSNRSYLYATFDIYTDNTYSEFFFQVPVQETTTIPVLVETVEQIPTVMTTVMKIIIPVGLAILGIGLIIYLMKQVIYLHL